MIEKTVTTTVRVRLSDTEIREALESYARRKWSASGSAQVKISADTSWEAEGENLFTAHVTFTETRDA